MSIRLSAKLRQATGPDHEDGAQYLHWCPGCKGPHVINTTKPNSLGASWTFDGNVEAPTFSPSINIVGQCHYFIRGGRIEFCGDSRHTLAGQTVDLPDYPERTE